MEKILQNEISNEDKLALINKYLSETINIIDKQLNPIKERDNINDNNNKTSGNTSSNKEKNSSDNNFELKLNSLEKIHNSLNIESDLLILTKNNIIENKTTFIEDIANILIQRNKLLNELLSLFFEKAKELIDKEKNFNHLSSMPSSYNLADTQNGYRSFSNKKNKDKEFKMYFSGRKYENMVNYDNNIRNRKKNKAYKNSLIKNKNANINTNIKTNLNTNINTNNNTNNNTNSNNSTKNLNLTKKNTTLTDFNKSINNLNCNELNPFHTNYFNYTSLSSINNQKSFSPQAINKRKYIIRNLNSPFIENNNYKTKQGINDKKKNNKNRSTSVIKEFKQNYRLNDHRNLEDKRSNLDNIINWEKLNLDKLNEIGVNLLTNSNNKKM